MACLSQAPSALRARLCPAPQDQAGLANVKLLAQIEHVSYCLSCLDRFRSIRARGLQDHTMKEYRVDEGRNTLDKIPLWFLSVNKGEDAG